jgi:hypothetical protein
MLLAALNPNATKVSQLQIESVRKLSLSYLPEKERPRHKGDVKFERSVSFLNVANEYNRLKYRHVSGLQRIDFKEAREELRELYEFLQWLYGDAQENPFDYI